MKHELMHKLWRYFSGFCLVSIALIITLVLIISFVLLPLLPSYRADIEVWLSAQLKQPIHLSDVAITWKGWQPALSLQGVQIRSPDKQATQLEIKQLNVALDGWSSLNSGQLVTAAIELSGSRVNLTQQADHSWTINGFTQSSTAATPDELSGKKSAAPATQENPPKQEAMAFIQWLLSQPQIKLHADQLSLNPLAPLSGLPEPIIFQNVEFALNRSIHLPAEPPTSSSGLSEFAAYDSPASPSTHDVHLATEINPCHQIQLTAQLPDTAWTNGGQLQIDVELDLAKQQAISKVQLTALTLNNVNTGIPRQTEVLGEFVVQAKENLNTWQIAFNRWHYQSRSATALELWSTEPVPMMDFEPPRRTQYDAQVDIRLQPSPIYRVHIPQFALVDLTKGGHWLINQLFNSANIVKTNQVFSELLAGKLHGTLDHFVFEYDALLATWQTRFTLNQLQAVNAHFQNTPLNASVLLTSKIAQIELQPTTLAWKLPRLYEQIFRLENLQAKLEWRVNEQGDWNLKIPKLSTILRKVPLTLSGSIQKKHAQTEPRLDLALKIADIPVTAVAPLIPEKLLPRLHHWLTMALQKGMLSNTVATFKGAPSQLFNKQTPGFNVTANVRKGTLHYSEGYPEIREVEAQLQQSGGQLAIRAKSALLMKNAKATQVEAIIDNVRDDAANLTIQGKVRADAQEGIAFLAQSPLSKDLNAEEDLPELAGAMNLDLNLLIPLDHSHGKVEGVIDFQQATMTDKKLGLTLQKMVGKVRFDDESVTAQNLQGTLLNQPANVDFTAYHGKTPKASQVRLRGIANADFLQQQLSPLSEFFAAATFYPRFKGQTSWQANLILPPKKEGTTHLEITTDFKGMSIDFPAPLHKANAEKATPFQLVVDIKPTENNQCVKDLSIRYNEQNSAALRFIGASLERGQVAFNAEQAELPSEAQFLVNGELKQFNPLAWKEILAFALENPQKTTNSKSLNKDSNRAEINTLPPLLISTRIRHLILSDYYLPNLVFNAEYEAATRGGIFKLNGDNAQGEIRLYPPPSGSANGLVTVNFDKLLLAELNPAPLSSPSASVETPKPKTPDPVKPKRDPRQMPAVQAFCANCQIGNFKLGQVSLTAAPTGNGWEIQQAKIQQATFELTAKAHWQAKNLMQQHTTLSATLQTNQVSEFMHGAGYRPSPLEGGNLQVLLDAIWEDGLFEFSKEKLVGTLSLLLQDGHIVAVEPGTVGRLIGLFDLHTLPRRLMMDFSDVFNQGLGFNILAGDFKLLDGNAVTDNLVIQAPVARIEITGETGLVSRSYNQLVKITPHFTNPLPVAGVIAGGITAGAVTLIVQKLLQNHLESAASFGYIVTGNWDKPKIEQTPHF